MRERKKRAGLNGTELKILALVAMVLDHTGLVFFSPGSGIWYLLRGIGRLAFPLYCFLLTEGYRHTKNVGRYLRNLLIFAAVSEIPFDMMLYGVPFDAAGQNVFFTLALGLMGICAGDRAEKAGKRVLMISCYLAACVLGWLVRADYGAEGVCLILLFWYAGRRADTWYPAPAAILFFMGGIEFLGILALPIVRCYNGRRGPGTCKYLFYLAYPLHILILVFLRGVLPG
ncbi:MAG: hypothetical protein HFI93_07805 [Lachnospiraceae bacterium]|nr:hypothetical protein [Lachnospiraceae bacterium]